MKTSLLVLAFVSLSCMLIADETNLYPNPQYTVNEKISEQKNKLYIDCHWYGGDLYFDGEHKGCRVVKVKTVKVSWGGFQGGLASSRDLKPGKYTFSVWCKLKDKPSYVYLHYSCLPAGKEKRIRNTKHYKGSSVPKGKWLQLSMNFEVKPGDTKQSFAYDVQSSDELGPRIVWFSNPQITPAQ